MDKSIISFKNINKLAIPALIAGVAEPLLSLTDYVIVKGIDINPTECTAAIGLVGTFISTLIWVFGQTRSALSSIIARYIGKSEFDKVNNLPIQAITIVVGLSIIIILSTYPFTKELFQLYGAKDITLQYTTDYYKIRILGLPFTLFTIVGFGIFRGLQNTSYTMIIALIGTAINISLDYVLIYGIDGIIQPLHLNGAALASLIAQAIMAIITLYLIITKTDITLKLSFPWHKDIKYFIIMVANLFIRTIALNIVFNLSTKFATGYGTENLASYSIAFQLWLTGSFLIDGYSSAGNILSGKLLGANEYSLLLNLAKKLLLYGICFGAILCAICFLFYEQIGSKFSEDPKVLTVFYNSFWIILLMQPLCAITYITDGFFKGMGRTNVLRNVLLFASLTVFFPALLLFDYLGLKNKAIWVSFIFFMAARGIPLAIILYKELRFKISKQEQAITN